MAREEARLLPVVEWEGREFLVDVDGRRFRNIDDVGDCIEREAREELTAFSAASPCVLGK